METFLEIMALFGFAIVAWIAVGAIIIMALTI
jgi:hypothetical protein